MRLCTVAGLGGANGIATVRVLARSLARVHPDRRLTVLVTPSASRFVEPGGEDFDVLPTSALGRPGLVEALATASPAAAAALLRALLVRHLHEQGDSLLLLPADAEVHAPLDVFEAALEAHAVALVPRLQGLLPEDGERPDGADLLRAGEIDDELVAVSAGARAFADWWVDRSYDALRDEEGTPLNSLTAARRVFDDVALIEDAGCDVSFWNLHERALERRDGALLTGDRPLVLLRFAGFRADRPWWLSEHASRVSVVDDPLLADLCGARAAALREAGWSAAARGSGERFELAPGIVLDDRLNQLHAEALDAGERFGELADAASIEGFLSWLREPAPHGAVEGINRYAFDVWRRRDDIREAYPNLDGGDAEGFSGWLWVHGRDQLGLQAPLLPPPPDWLDRATPEPPAVLVAGYLRGNLGLGEAARGYVRALRASGLPVATTTVSADPAGSNARRRSESREFEDLELPAGREPGVELLCVNADQLPELAAALGERPRRYTIGQWAWETDAIPERWDHAFSLIDEVWVYSRYVAENIARASPVPVIVVPLPVEPPPEPTGVAPVPLAGDDFAFLFAFDHLSTLERKNPVGLVQAFTQAFAPGEGPKLVLKTIHGDFRPEAHDRLRWMAAGRDDVVLLDAALSPEDMAALYSRADCYVSLHRSEGFGLTLAESMARGKPVIATAFGGNTDFMTPANSYLVDWAPTAVGPDAEHYPADGSWAEPSVEHAAVLMREVWEDRDGARMRGARAARDVAENLSAEAVGAVARRRLERILAGGGGVPGDEPVTGSLDELDARMTFDLEGGAGRGPRAVARRAMLRAIRPYATAERRVDEGVAGALRRLGLELAAERSARVRDRDRIARLERQLAELREATPAKVRESS